ncbi:MAG: hypothetical protein J0H29_15035 [Sphingobacteriales bacterium]|nr:hypothetical protein [Sphingobacteriales bacterium]OJY87417.1 MAG: hypothetical protein BGP14_08730 [Sphingobacteriales bacterium 44-15]
MAKSPKKSAARPAKKTAKNNSARKGTAVKRSLPRSQSVLRTRGVDTGSAGESTTLDTLYIVDGSGNAVSLEIKVGAEEQTSDMTIHLDNTMVAENHSGDLPATTLGTNKSINGKKLRIVATITDTSRKTNFTSLSIRLTGGMDANNFSLSKTVDEEGASADYLCLIEFFRP